MAPRTSVLWLLICCWLAAGLVTLQTDFPIPLRPSGRRAPVPECGTTEDRSRLLQPAAITTVADGEPMMFLQEPAILSPDRKGRSRFVSSPLSVTTKSSNSLSPIPSENRARSKHGIG